MLDDFAKLVPPELHARSGSVFYFGRDAFRKPSAIYVLGLNPGGDPEGQASATVGKRLSFIMSEAQLHGWHTQTRAGSAAPDYSVASVICSAG